MHQYGPYGYAPPPPIPTHPPLPNTGNGIASLVIGCIAAVTCLWAVVILPAIGVLLGIIGIAETRPGGPRRGRPMAVVGLILNAALTVVGVAVLISLIADTTS
ncbi:hypothetical protein FZ103_00205 [Streptomonospora sp. PA3]|uniref:DUF4190 domain-containing protein n=1 Tax=Streptomonospora sp. PA3 TaxID=2607326 RepID=UPI0012DCADCB|nr:hypothetical protein [Streptomonospora sp. PA3]MUL39616.1 hypothetical protein [Streptomonospora sp. PA3]